MSGWQEWLQSNRDALVRETPYEWEFARTVLARVPGLQPGKVALQLPFKDTEGRPRRMDFAIQDPPEVRVAIEVDGYDKTGSGSGMSKEQFSDFLVRQTSLNVQGWMVLRFDNAYFTRSPDRCIRQIELALRNVQTTDTTAPVLSPSEKAELERLRAESNDIDSLRQEVAGLVASHAKSRRTIIAAAMAVVIAAVTGAVVYTQSRSDGLLGVPPSGGECLADAPIKGNRSQRTSERIYHVKGQQFYEATTAIRCFHTEDEAATAGYRRSKV